ncbi:hypothetical protein [Heyndrickxia acidiproducens]|uniref:hypothetical protein n=1 Tax=Heyndrickxia acidiproducens TaxID=1121084 RepID=UPI00146DACE2|nr:hypothetical protein [Heyndrickxia acidiproducens]
MFFIGYSAVLEVQQMGWVVLLLLLYFILNIAILLYKKKGWRLFLLTVSILAATAGYRLINPLFLILLPLSIQEWLSEWAVPKWVLFTLPLLKFDRNPNLHARRLLLASGNHAKSTAESC